MAAGGMGFLNLAYLMEVSVVLNLAYRELKFPELQSKLQNEVNNTLNNINKRGIDDEKEKCGSTESFNKLYPEYVELESLLDEDVGKNSNWKGDDKKAMIFIEENIKTKKSFKTVNFFVYANIAILIFITFFSAVSIDSSLAIKEITQNLDIFAIASAAQESEKVATHGDNIFFFILWCILFFILVFMTVLPLVYIIKGTNCHETLFGSNGAIAKRERAILEKFTVVMQRGDSQAGSLNFDDSNDP